MKIAVVTPVGPDTDPDHLRRCIGSVAIQKHPVVHVLVFDGPLKCELAFDSAQSIWLPHAAGDIGSTPRAIGSTYAFGQGFDAVCWLDADNWYIEDHVTKLVRHHHDTGQPVVCSGRLITDATGNELESCVEQVKGSRFFDTNTAMVMGNQSGKHIVHLWTQLRPNQHIVGDRLVLGHADALGLLSCHYEPTVIYRSRLKFHYDRYKWDGEGVDLEVKEYSP